jgi:uncharacterized SAM-dependent methyltransferase
MGEGGLLIAGVESVPLRRSRPAANAAARNATADFHSHLLQRINRELDGNIDVQAFQMESRTDVAQQRVQTHLVCQRSERVTVMGRDFSIAAGESIQVSESHRYPLHRLQRLAAQAGWSPLQFWTDSAARFAIHVFERSRGT